jgi:Peptidase_C39 like family
MLTLKTLTPTVLKRKPIQSTELPEEMKRSLAGDISLAVESYAVDRNYVRVILPADSANSPQLWYVFGEHVYLYDEQGARIYPRRVPPQAQLDVPYKSQRDNLLNPDGACNVTSLAMCLAFFGLGPSGEYGQLEDELYDYAERKGLSRHDPHDLAQIVQAYGYRDKFRTDATFAQVKEWLCDGKPAVVHGYFTDFGHILVLTGYDDQGFIVNDPFGEWFEWGYDRNAPGEPDTKGQGLRYSYGLITRLCMPDNGFWVHFISKP